MKAGPVQDDSEAHYEVAGTSAEEYDFSLKRGQNLQLFWDADTLDGLSESFNGDRAAYTPIRRPGLPRGSRSLSCLECTRPSGSGTRNEVWDRSW